MKMIVLTYFHLEFIYRLRCLNIAWTELTLESVRYICETIPRCIEQLNISGQRYNLTDDCKKLRFEKNLKIFFFNKRYSIISTSCTSFTYS